jgi:hypothetical protein
MLKWIIVIWGMNASGHPYIANSQWMDQPGQSSLDECERAVATQKALHPHPTTGDAAVWQCLAVDASQSKALIPTLNGDWQ